MELNAYAKINLSLDVLGEREDGYHDVRMITQSINLHDVLRFNERQNGIRLYCTNSKVPCDSTNTVYKAFMIIKERFGITSGMEADIEKNIPCAAGLAGGSTDAAAAIIAANELWNIKMTYGEMLQIAKQVGADVPFFLKGGCMLAEGIGEVLTEINSIKGVNIVLAKPNISVSTKETYQSLHLDEIVLRPDIDRLARALNDGNIKYVADNMVNVLEVVTAKKYPVIGEIKNIMIQFGALGSLMSGSGPTVFGIFESMEDAERCYNRLRDYMKDVCLVQTI